MQWLRFVADSSLHHDRPESLKQAVLVTVPLPNALQHLLVSSVLLDDLKMGCPIYMRAYMHVTFLTKGVAYAEECSLLIGQESSQYHIYRKKSETFTGNDDISLGVNK